MKMKRFLLVVFSLLLLLAFIGCSDDTNNSSVTNPNPNNFYPKGYVQGKIVDSCTLKPIVGAVVDIGVAKATTDSNGQYSMSNVPATSYVDYNAGGDVAGSVDLDLDRNGRIDDADIDLSLELSGTTSGWIGQYSATIDMTGASVGGVSIKGSSTLKYADKYYRDQISVKFSSLHESQGNVSTTSNHDTPVAQIGNGNFDFLIGQLTAGISGDAVWGATYDAATGKIALLPVSGYVVALYTLTGTEMSGNSTTGSIGHRVAVTTTDASGHFSIPGLETMQAYALAVVDSATGSAKYAGYTLTNTLCDNDITTFNTQDGKAILVYSTDVVCPFVQLATVNGQGPYADLSKASIANGADVVLTFSEPIKATNLNTGRALLGTTDYYSTNTLYQDIAVNFLGFKSSNIAHTLAWNSAMTQLTIHIAAGALQPGSVYGVQILKGDNLADASGHQLTIGMGTQDLPVSSTLIPGTVKYSCAETVDAYGPIGVMQFTTWGVVPSDDVADLHVSPVTPLSGFAALPYELDYNDGAKLDWTAVMGAKSYNIYCRMIQWMDTTCNTDPCDVQCTTNGNYHPFILMANTNDTSFFTNFQGPGGFYTSLYNMDETNFEYVERKNIKLSYECYVNGVDADAIESQTTASNIVLIEDTVDPTITSVPTAFTTGQVFAADSEFSICFSEPMNEYEIEHATWAFNAAAFATAVPSFSVDYVYNGITSCARFNLETGGNIITLHSTSANVVGTCANITILSLTAGNITDVAGNPLDIGTNLPLTAYGCYVSP